MEAIGRLPNRPRREAGRRDTTKNRPPPAITTKRVKFPTPTKGEGRHSASKMAEKQPTAENGSLGKAAGLARPHGRGLGRWRAGAFSGPGKAQKRCRGMLPSLTAT